MKNENHRWKEIEEYVEQKFGVLGTSRCRVMTSKMLEYQYRLIQKNLETGSKNRYSLSQNLDQKILTAQDQDKLRILTRAASLASQGLTTKKWSKRVQSNGWEEPEVTANKKNATGNRLAKTQPSIKRITETLGSQNSTHNLLQGKKLSLEFFGNDKKRSDIKNEQMTQTSKSNDARKTQKTSQANNQFEPNTSGSLAA